MIFFISDGPRTFSREEKSMVTPSFGGGKKAMVPSLYDVRYSLKMPILIIPGWATFRTPKVGWWEWPHVLMHLNK